MARSYTFAAKQVAAAVREAYTANILFTRIEFDKGRIFASPSYKSGILLPRD